MAEKRPLNAAELDGLFTAARANAPEPSDELMARIIADADAQIGQPKPVRAQSGLFAAALSAIGGWPAAAGLVTASLVGLSFGLITPETLSDITDGYLASASEYELEDLLPSYGDLLGEG